VEVCDVILRFDEERQELRNTMAQLEFDGLEYPPIARRLAIGIKQSGISGKIQ